MAVSRSVAALVGAVGVSLALSSAARADEFAWSATFTGTSDYVFRGISQTDNDPTVQGSVGATYGMFYGGIWASGLDWTNLYDPPANDGEIEVDFYAGVKPTWGPVTFDFGVIYYAYPGVNDDAGPEADYVEWKAGASGQLLPGLTGGFTFYYSDDVADLEELVYEGTLAYSLPKFFVFSPTVSGVLGYTDFEGDSADYTYWNAGLALTVDKLTFDFRYWDTDVDTEFYDERFVFSATLALP